MNVQINFRNYNECDKLAMFYSRDLPDFIKFSKNDDMCFINICKFYNFKSGDLQCEPELPEHYVDLKMDYMPIDCIIQDVYHDTTIDGEYLLVLYVQEV